MDNGDIGINLQVTDSYFETSVMNGLFADLASAPTINSKILFDTI